MTYRAITEDTMKELFTALQELPFFIANPLLLKLQQAGTVVGSDGKPLDATVTKPVPLATTVDVTPTQEATPAQ